MSEHTKEPWKLHGLSIQAEGSCDTFAGPVWGTIARVEQCSYDDSDGRHWSTNGTPEDNGHLIAASPELLDQLIAAYWTLDVICIAGHVHLVSAALPEGYGLDTIRAAIAKAKGQTP